MANRFVLNNISYHGAGAIQEIPGELTRRGFSKAFVATDADLVRFGVTKKVTDLLDEAGIAWEMFSDIKPNPTIENVQAGVTAFKASGADCIVAVGGGSAMDTAKGHPSGRSSEKLPPCQTVASYRAYSPSFSKPRRV